ncbi:MAG: DUF5610 domain-containing protein [Magnetococcales bacterium]|nr:DUF5610 domain-containing protein [Magnetococcales bacterium]MBF0157321.1 DUF5610 domain-containing protein [Magnetococcales bacterium]
MIVSYQSVSMSLWRNGAQAGASASKGVKSQGENSAATTAGVGPLGAFGRLPVEISPEASRLSRLASQGDFSILLESFDATITTDDQGQITEILIQQMNASLEKTLGEVVATQPNEVVTPEIYSPEWTADFILDAATSLFPAYTANHPDTEAQKRLEEFLSLVKGAIERGFAGARETLSAMGLINPESDKEIDRTFDLVMEGLGTFREAQLKLMDPVTA